MAIGVKVLERPIEHEDRETAVLLGLDLGLERLAFDGLDFDDCVFDPCLRGSVENLARHAAFADRKNVRGDEKRDDEAERD